MFLTSPSHLNRFLEQSKWQASWVRVQRLSSFSFQVSHTPSFLYSLSTSATETTMLPMPIPLLSDPPPPFLSTLNRKRPQHSMALLRSLHHVSPKLYHSLPAMQIACNLSSTPVFRPTVT
ncbi:hypothetical protein V8E53_000160, partial [Lactarius tabidus]